MENESKTKYKPSKSYRCLLNEIFNMSTNGDRKITNEEFSNVLISYIVDELKCSKEDTEDRLNWFHAYKNRK